MHECIATKIAEVSPPTTQPEPLSASPVRRRRGTSSTTKAALTAQCQARPDTGLSSSYRHRTTEPLAALPNLALINQGGPAGRPCRRRLGTAGTPAPRQASAHPHRPQPTSTRCSLVLHHVLHHAQRGARFSRLPTSALRSSCPALSGSTYRGPCRRHRSTLRLRPPTVVVLGLTSTASG